MTAFSEEALAIVRCRTEYVLSDEGITGLLVAEGIDHCLAYGSARRDPQNVDSIRRCCLPICRAERRPLIL